jgi:glycosyltransferase involved in cell wall biosynthesis
VSVVESNGAAVGSEPSLAPVDAAPGRSVHGKPRVAVVHDYLTQRGGAERVALSMLRAFPGARLVTSIYAPNQTFAEFGLYDVETLPLNRFAAFRKDPRRAMPLLARAFSSHTLTDVDVVLCSSSGWAHGVRAPGAVKLVYCHSPARWLYEQDDYFAGLPAPARRALRAALTPLRRWDVAAAASVNQYLVNSQVVKRRLARAYGREAPVLWPPVSWTDGPHEPVAGLEPGFLLCIGRPRGYKHVDIVTEAFESLPHERLVVVGDLPHRPKRAWPKTIVGLSHLPDAQMRWLYANCDGLVAASNEDFGLTPVEAFTFGKPTIVLRRGGYLDSNIEDVTSVFIEDDSVGAVLDAVRRFRATTFSEAAIRTHAETFSEARFADRLHAEVDRLLSTHSGGVVYSQVPRFLG